MLRITLPIPAEEVNYLQRFAFEMEGQKRIIKELIVDNATSPAVLEGETFKKYNEKYEQSSASFEIAKGEIERKFVPAELKNAPGLTNWNLDYSTAVMTITYSGKEFDACVDKIVFAVPGAEVQVLDSVADTAGCACGGNCR